jgi:hypothetical protein
MARGDRNLLRNKYQKLVLLTVRRDIYSNENSPDIFQELPAELYLKIQAVPCSKHPSSQWQKPSS